VSRIAATRSGGQRAGGTSRPRLPRLDDLVNTLEFEEVAQQALDAGVFSTIAGGDRSAFDRITLRPRMMVPTVDLDMSAALCGDTHFTPIVVGPVAEQRRYHVDGELATARGASAARAGFVVSRRSSVPLGEIVAQATTPLWFATSLDAGARPQIDRAVAAGCKAVCITVGTVYAPGPRADRSAINWKAIDEIRRGLDVPLVIKGILTPHDAGAAIQAGAAGIVVSDGGAPSGPRAPIEILASIADVSAGKATVLVDGSFRRGSDIVKALALGAQGVLIARPVMWGLAAYGAEGVQAVIEMLQSDLARNMGALGAPDLKSLTRAMIRIHKR
jgi:4-hydroxymandelate oxidase